MLSDIEKENSLLRKCVEFYAEKENWNFTIDESTIAQDTLEKIEGLKYENSISKI